MDIKSESSVCFSFIGSSSVIFFIRKMVDYRKELIGSSTTVQGDPDFENLRPPFSDIRSEKGVCEALWSDLNDD